MKLMKSFGILRWDSSDPDRAPPPLPLNPGSSSPVTKTKTSTTIAAAAEALTARAREGTYITNPLPSKSPEKSLIKGQYHKRMQSFQNPNSSIRDLSGYLDNSRSPERSPERPSRPLALDYDIRSPERSPTRSGTPTPSARDPNKDIPSLQETARPPPKAILAENTPPSATMIALQNTPTPKERDPSFSNVTNGSTALVRTPQTFEAISSQILSLTSIATNLQREMAQLSRRSKDNATDLISLKEATNARDEDIRKSLRDLVTNLSSRLLEPNSDGGSRNTNHYGRSPGSYLLDNKPHATPPGLPKAVSLPRIPSPASFAATIEREIANSPSPYSIDGAASIALLEKILREMGTKEGQDRLLFSLSEIKNNSTMSGSDPSVAKKLEEILAFLKDNNDSRALVTRRNDGISNGDRPPKLELDYENAKSMPLARTTRNTTPHLAAGMDGRPYASPRAADFVSDDILKLLKRMKDSITEGGGLSAEIKALVRELRGEVLGMGREIGRKLEQAESSRGQSNSRADAHGPGREEIAHIVEQGLAELKEHLERVMHERRRQSSSSTISRSTVDSQEIYHAIKNALSEMPPPQHVTVQQPATGIEREEILEAVREAWETYKPEIELQNFGLERDEILTCLKEGLQEYQPQNESREIGGASYEEVLDAVNEGLKNFQPPAPIETEASITKEEILVTVRECLDSFQFPIPKVEISKETEITREDVLEAVKEGMSAQAPLSREIEINRDDLFDAVKAGLEGAPTPMAGVGEQVLDKMQDLIDEMRGEFKQYSSANGRDTEQVLDAMKDGLESLRAGIETYVDRAADVTGKDEIIETVRDGLEHLRIDIEGSIANAPRGNEPTSSGELLDAMEKEFEHLRQTISSSMLRNAASLGDKDEVLDAIKDGFDGIRDNSLGNARSGADEETIAVMKEEFGHLRETLATTLVRGGSSDSGLGEETIAIMKEEFERLRESFSTTLVRGGSSLDKEEIAETIREGLDTVRAEIDQPHRPESMLSNTSELLDAFNEGLDGLRNDIEKIINKPSDNNNELQEAFSEGLDGLRIDIEKVISKPVDMTVSYEILDTLKDGLASVRADIDRLRSDRIDQEITAGPRGGEVVIADNEHIRRNDIENLEVLITQLRIKVEALDSTATPLSAPEPTQPAEENAMKKDLVSLETMMKEIHASMVAMNTSVAIMTAREHSRDEMTVTKEDTDAIETLLRNTKAKLDEFVIPEPEGMARIEHVESLGEIMKSTRDAIEDLSTQVEANNASKDDTGMLEALIKDMHVSLDEMRERFSADDAGEKIVKTDLEAVESQCLDIKAKIEELRLPDMEILPTKAGLEDLTALFHEFKERMEADAGLTAQAFESRKVEHGGIADKIEDVKGFLDDVRLDIKSKIDESGQGIESLAKSLETINDVLVSSETNATVKEIMEIVNREFERTHGTGEALKLETEQLQAVVLEKQDEHRLVIIADLSDKIDARFDEIMIKYDDAQLAAEAKADALKEKDLQQAETLKNTHILTEDLKLLIDSLGNTLTNACERMGEDSKTVYNRVEDIAAKLDETTNSITTDIKSDHQLARAEISKTLVAVESVQAHSNEYHPKILSAISDVLNVIGHQFEQAQRATDEIKTSVEAIPSAIPLPAITAAPPSPPPEREIPMIEKYDDSGIHTKLDKLADHIEEAGKMAAQFELLEQIRSEVVTSASNLSAFMTTQQTALTETRHSRAREAAEVALALEKRIMQKETVESDVARLCDERSTLSTSAEILRNDCKELASQKSRLQADLTRLETALQIRREEMQFMEARAEGLEKRILEGVLDHSRSLLITSRPQSSLKAMNLKRVSSTASNKSIGTRTSSASTTATTIPTTVGSTVNAGISMALKRRPPPRMMNGSVTNNAKGDRRILSLSTIGANRGPIAEKSMVLANPSFVSSGTGRSNAAFGAAGLKRSHSVKSNFPARKTSWGGTRLGGMYADELGEGNKENSVLDEEDEESGEGGTERRTSYGTQTETERRPSYAGTDTETGSYGTGSVIDGDDDRRTNYAASTIGTVGTKEAPQEEEDLEYISDDQIPYDETGRNIEPGDQQLALHQGNTPTQSTQDMVVFSLPSDSGIGTDLPTAALEGRNEYFKPG